MSNLIFTFNYTIVDKNLSNDKIKKVLDHFNHLYVDNLYHNIKTLCYIYNINNLNSYTCILLHKKLYYIPISILYSEVVKTYDDYYREVYQCKYNTKCKKSEVIHYNKHKDDWYNHNYEKKELNYIREAYLYLESLHLYLILSKLVKNKIILPDIFTSIVDVYIRYNNIKNYTVL